MEVPKRLILDRLFHPLMRVWIEIRDFSSGKTAVPFHPLMRVWIEMSISTSVSGGAFVSPSYEGVD